MIKQNSAIKYINDDIYLDTVYPTAYLQEKKKRDKYKCSISTFCQEDILAKS